MNTHYLQQLSFHKLEIHQPTASLHSFVLVRNSLLESIRTQQQQDSWLDACFDELAPESSTSANTTLMEEQVYETEQQQLLQEDDGMDDIDMLLLEEDDDDDLSDEDQGPVSPEQSTLLQQPQYQSRPFGSPAFFIPMDDDEDEDDEDADDFMASTNITTLLPLATAASTTFENDHSSSSTQVHSKSTNDTISDYWPSQHGLPPSL